MEYPAVIELDFRKDPEIEQNIPFVHDNKICKLLFTIHKPDRRIGVFEYEDGTRFYKVYRFYYGMIPDDDEIIYWNRIKGWSLQSKE